MSDLGRFQTQLVDRRAAPIAMIAGLFALMGLLFAVGGVIPSPELPQLQPAACCLDNQRCSPFDRLPTDAQLLSVRAWQTFTWELEEPLRFPMPDDDERADRLLDRDIATLRMLMNDQVTPRPEDQLDREWFERLLSERDWPAIDEAPPPPEADIMREGSRQKALERAQLEVQRLEELELRLRNAWDLMLAQQMEQAERERAELTVTIQQRHELAREFSPWLLLGSLQALVICLVATWKARGVSLVVTQTGLAVQGARKPTAWLRDFALRADETVLYGHDGAVWRLPPTAPELAPELEQALRLVQHATPEALEREREQQRHLSQQLGRLQERDRLLRSQR